MWGRFYKKLDKEYSKKFKDTFALKFYHVNNEKKFYRLLKQALERGSVVTDEELIELVGEDIYKYARETQHLVEGVDYF